jgi:sterol 3beta-glucosyltransferase
MGARLRSQDLAKAIAFAERDDVKARAVQLGQRMAQENGLEQAVATLERLAGRGA